MLKQRAPSWGPSKSTSNMSPSTWRTRSSIPPRRRSRGPPGRCPEGRPRSPAGRDGGGRAPSRTRRGRRRRRAASGHRPPAAPPSPTRRWRGGRAGTGRGCRSPSRGRRALCRAARRGARRGPGLRARRTSPSSGRCRRGSRRGRCRRRDPAKSGRGGHLVAPVGTQLQVAERSDHVEDADGPGRLQAKVLGQLGRIARALGQRRQHPGALGDLQRARDRHRVHRLADRRRHLVEEEADPLQQSIRAPRRSASAPAYPP